MTGPLKTIRIRLLIAVLLLILTKAFLGMGVAEQLAATGPAPLTSVQTTTGEQ